MRLTWPALPALLLISLCGCDETPNISGAWTGEASATVDAEAKTFDLVMDIEQTDTQVTGSVFWGPIEATVSSAEFSGQQLTLVSEWAEGSITFRGFTTGEVFKGRFSIVRNVDREPFKGAFELNKE